MTTRGKISESDKAYLAGVIDSDGSISVIRSYLQRKEYRCPRFVLEMTVTNTEPTMMQWIKDKFGGSYCTRKRSNIVYIDGRKITPKQITYNWKATAKKGLGILEQIVPYLIGKKRQAELAIEFQKNILNRKMKSVKAGTGLSHYLADEEISKRTWYSKTIQKLNKHLISPAETK